MSLRGDYDQIFRSLSRVELQTGTPELELPDLFGPSRDGRWLGFYTAEGLRLALERYGFFADLAEVGYTETNVELRCDDPDEHLLRIWSDDPALDDAPLLELVARRDILVPNGELESRLGRSSIGVLNIEWLQLQRPDGDFDDTRPPLPGQRYPGLGLGREILELLRQAAKRLGLEALVTVPSYFHNAYFYSLEFQYLDPREQGLFLALCRDVLPSALGSVAAASWAIVERMVVEHDEPFEWFHDVMFAPISDGLVAYASAEAYHAESGAALRERAFEVFEAPMRRHLEARGIMPLDRQKIATWIDEA